MSAVLRLAGRVGLMAAALQLTLGLELSSFFLGTDPIASRSRLGRFVSGGGPASKKQRWRKMVLKKEFRATKLHIEEKMQFHLGAQFKKLFSETASQAIPERFAALLDQLELSESSDQSSPGRSSVVKR
jgi:hypothetical protein